VRHHLESQYNARIVQWNEPDDEGASVFSAFVGGQYVVAPSLALLISALQDRERAPLVLLPMAA
jgi:hypothetical protein